ncbi:hypothetical protein CDL12_23923 [Handroanthus impetiginosus]|uniref:Small auxin-up RNA n=1 Tax=Handroanthus impetiginosus TaxID=429701 RepID=A0A2G9GEB2_9LAMI|nr:hypothetical protein CDL12_23923 [Handroanthus impetiginosus]
MARTGKKKNGGIVERLQKSLLLGKKSSSGNEQMAVPDDVKEGHFAVMAVDDGELKRFIVPLSFLTHPSFLRLLEQAAEEYGFDRQGALTVPCRPSELEGILAEQWEAERGSREEGGGAEQIHVKSYVKKSCSKNNNI